MAPVPMRVFSELEEVPLSIVGGFDIHRRQITFDYLDTATGGVERGKIAPADREHLRAWLARFDACPDVAFALEGCTGWRFVVEELQRAGVAAHLAEPADTSAARGPNAGPRPTGPTPGCCVICSPTAGCRSRGFRRRTCWGCAPGWSCSRTR